MTETHDEIAHLFGVVESACVSGFGEEAYPGYPQLAVAANAEGQYAVGTMKLGFLPVMKRKNG